jgi:hypothetical protein
MQRPLPRPQFSFFAYYKNLFSQIVQLAMQWAQMWGRQASKCLLLHQNWENATRSIKENEILDREKVLI